MTMSMGECVWRLMQDEYYEDVAACFIEEAVETAVRERGAAFHSFEELNSYIKQNLI